MRYVFVCLVLCFLVCVTGLAHPGGTDSRGGHTDHSTGKYHYHHGYPAHQHSNGECPYDFDDKTGKNSGSSISSSRNSSSYSNRSTPSAFKRWLNTHIAPIWAKARILLLVSLIPVLCVGTSAYSKKRKIWEQEEANRQKEEAERRERWLEERRREDEIRSRLTKPAYALSALPIENGEQVVFITLSGIKYHREGCGVLKRFAYSQYKVGLSTALHHGFSPCSRCCADMPEPDLKRDNH